MVRYGKIDQIGLVVEDLDFSIRQWIDKIGVGPWTVFRNATLTGLYRGEHTIVKMDVALSYQGDTQIELIHVTNGARSPYLDETGQPLAGLHHLAWITDDLDASVAKAESDGLKMVFRAEDPGNRVAYMEAEGQAGLLFEFIENDQIRQLVADGLVACRDWDGSNPVRTIDLAA